MPGSDGQPPLDLVAGQPDGALERVGHPGGGDQGAGAGRVDVHPQPLPRRDLADRVGRRLDPQLEVGARAGRALAVAVDEHPEARERLLAGHLLLDDRRGQRLHHQAGAADPPAAVAPPGLPRPRGARVEAGQVVVGAEQRRDRRRAPSRRPGPQASARTTPSPERGSMARVAGPSGVRMPRQCGRRRSCTSGRRRRARRPPSAEPTEHGQSGRQSRVRPVTPRR